MIVQGAGAPAPTTPQELLCLAMTINPLPRRGRGRPISTASIGRRPWPAYALALLLLPAVSPAAGQAPLAAGTRIRLQFPESPVSDRPQWTAGALVSWDAQAIVLALESGEELRVESDAVSQVQFSQGMRRAVWKGAWIGGLAVGAPVGIAAFATELGCTEEPGDWFGCFNPVAVGIVVFGMGAIVGGAAGALIGAFIPVERWRDAPPPIRFEAAPASGGGTALGFRLNTGPR